MVSRVARLVSKATDALARGRKLESCQSFDFCHWSLSRNEMNGFDPCKRELQSRFKFQNGSIDVSYSSEQIFAAVQKKTVKYKEKYPTFFSSSRTKNNKYICAFYWKTLQCTRISFTKSREATKRQMIERLGRHAGHPTSLTI